MARKSTNSGNGGGLFSFIGILIFFILFTPGLRYALCSNTSRDNWSCFLVCLSFTLMVIIIISIIFSLIYM
jgi:hypothetical protein